ncbi:MAG: aspartate aminotransferase family protein [Candidatus Rokubacteria bacterium]|nr:aspartate aminotransferase family protein [Candidatus Rokubacteria bacterium]
MTAGAAATTKSRDIAYQLHPYTHLRKHEAEGPLVITSGHGIYVQDEDGREYIEAMAGLWCTALGWGEERLVEAAARQMRKLPYYHLFASKANDVAVDLAERLITLMPVKMSRVFFNNSGSEANDTAVKLVWYYNNARGKHRKKKIIARLRGYHGVTVAAASLTGLPTNHREFDLPLTQIRHADCPYFYRSARPGESEEDFATRMAESLDAQIQREDPETVAAFIAEPVMGAGGVIVPPRTYFEKVQAVLRKHDVLFIADEVICGFGRTGRMFGTETYALKPDIMTMAKALSSAYLPISALAISEDIYQGLLQQSDKLGVFAHGYTYSGHPVACAVAIEALRIYEERDIVSHVRKMSGPFQDGLRRLADHPLVGDVRGVGLMAGVELVRDKASRAPFDPPATAGALFVERATAHGLIVRNLQDTIALCPPLIITEAEVEEVLRRFEKALADTATALGA